MEPSSISLKHIHMIGLDESELIEAICDRTCLLQDERTIRTQTWVIRSRLRAPLPCDPTMLSRSPIQRIPVPGEIRRDLWQLVLIMSSALGGDARDIAMGGSLYGVRGTYRKSPYTHTTSY